MSQSKFERALDRCDGHTGEKNRLTMAREAYVAKHAPTNQGLDMSDFISEAPRLGKVLRGDKLVGAMKRAEHSDFYDRPDVRAFYGFYYD